MKFVYRSGSRPLQGFTIRRGVGIGGFGEVYFATSDAGKEVALKRIQRNHDVELRGVGHCLNLKHSNLIDLYDVRHDEEGEAWVVMEYVAGESLKDAVDRHPEGMRREDVLFWFRGMAAGVEYLHEHGIVHRDLKPGNVFLDDATVKIGDYGLSKFISCSRRSGQTESVGTFHYMAPEIGKGVYGKEIDVYALGVILFEMLTGRLPFEGESSQEIIMKHLTATPDLSQVPTPFRETIRRALQKDPNQRFRDVASMLRSLPDSDIVTFTANTRPAIATPPVRQSSGAGIVFLGDEHMQSAGSASESDMEFGPLQVSRDGTPPSAPAQPTTTLLSEEPVARMVRQGCARAQNNWRRSGMNGPTKAFLIVVGIAVAAVNIYWLAPLLVAMAALYLIYLGVRSVMMSIGGPTTAAAAVPLPMRSPPPPIRQRPNLTPPRPVQPPPRKAKSSELRRFAASESAKRPASERLGGFFTSLVAAPLLTIAFIATGLAFAGAPLDHSVAEWTNVAWISVAGVAMGWAMLALSRVWSNEEEDVWARRATMVALGAGVGAALWAAGAFLRAAPVEMFHMADGSGWFAPSVWYEASLPKAPACMAYCALVFGLGATARLVDPMRGARFSLLHTAALGALAWLVHFLIYFPQPYGVLMVVATATAVQLASPYVDRSERKRLAARQGMVL